ncbi:EKA-like protein [Blumeria hordei DH14]|uniref:EKA-like protein n=1 Tax=Blumeria graminis f. sp. hordei (strain DH14) TaxID=546991 RepID=N1JGP5_BLUG1|nr:EKA-like protein [Blumeria hordei DH14]
MFASEASAEGKSPKFPDKEMTDSEPVRSVKIGPETHRPIELVPEASSSRGGKEVVRERKIEHAKISARKFAVPASKGTASTQALEFPRMLQSVMEAEKRRTTQIKAHLAICYTAIISVEAALSPLSIGEDRESVEGFKVYLRAAIDQFVQSGLESTPPVLPDRPSNPLPPMT